jgi:hypothetical protein
MLKLQSNYKETHLLEVVINYEEAYNCHSFRSSIKMCVINYTVLVISEVIWNITVWIQRDIKYISKFTSDFSLAVI